MPDSASVVAQDALPTLRTNERAQGFIHDLAFGFKTREFARLADQAFVNFDIGPAHKNTIHHCLDKLCIRDNCGQELPEPVVAIYGRYDCNDYRDLLSGGFRNGCAKLDRGGSEGQNSVK